MNDIKRIDKVVDEIVDLQANFKNDIEARVDAKLDKYDNILKEMVQAKLESKINEIDIRGTGGFEARIESSRVKIDGLEKKVKDLEIKLETNNGKISILEAARFKTAEKRILDLEGSEIDLATSIEDQNDHLTHGNEESPKKMKMSEV